MLRCFQYFVCYLQYYEPHHTSVCTEWKWKKFFLWICRFWHSLNGLLIGVMEEGSIGGVGRKKNQLLCLLQKGTKGQNWKTGTSEIHYCGSHFWSHKIMSRREMLYFCMKSYLDCQYSEDEISANGCQQCKQKKNEFIVIVIVYYNMNVFRIRFVCTSVHRVAILTDNNYVIHQYCDVYFSAWLGVLGTVFNGLVPE